MKIKGPLSRIGAILIVYVYIMLCGELFLFMIDNDKFTYPMKLLINIPMGLLVGMLILIIIGLLIMFFRWILYGDDY